MSQDKGQTSLWGESLSRVGKVCDRGHVHSVQQVDRVCRQLVSEAVFASTNSG